jgi:hypothetical protein
MNRVGLTNVSISDLGLGGAPIGILLPVVDEDVAIGSVIQAWNGSICYWGRPSIFAWSRSVGQ